MNREIEELRNANRALVAERNALMHECERHKAAHVMTQAKLAETERKLAEKPKQAAVIPRLPTRKHTRADDVRKFLARHPWSYLHDIAAAFSVSIGAISSAIKYDPTGIVTRRSGTRTRYALEGAK